MTVLGSMLADGKAVETGLDLLSGDDFYSAANRTIFLCMKGMYDRKEPLDVVTLVEALRGKGELGKTGGEAYIGELAENIVAPANMGHYARLLQGYTTRRAAAMFGLAIHGDALDDETEAYTLFDRAARFTDELREKTAGCNDLPAIESSVDLLENLPALKPALIDGVLRKGHKMSLSGPSKAGKSFALINLALSLANGAAWLGLHCLRSRVLYINFEIDPDSCCNRFITVANARGLPYLCDNLNIWNLRGYNAPIEDFCPRLIGRIGRKRYEAIIIDPMYKLYQSREIRAFDENSATSLTYLFNAFDRVIKGCGCAIIWAGHYSKGMQGAKNAIDRTSGSGVLARDPDAILTLTELDQTDAAYRMESVLREFPSTVRQSLRWKYPLHEIDPSLDAEGLRGAPGRDRVFTADEFVEVFVGLDKGKGVTIEELKDSLGAGSINTFRERIRELDNAGLNSRGLRVRGNRVCQQSEIPKDC